MLPFSQVPQNAEWFVNAPFSFRIFFPVYALEELSGNGNSLRRLGLLRREIRLYSQSVLIPKHTRHLPLQELSYLVKNNPDHQTAARTPRNILAVAHVAQRNLKAVAARARVVVDLQRLVVEAVFDFDFVVEVELFVGHGGGFVYSTRGWTLLRRSEGEGVEG